MEKEKNMDASGDITDFGARVYDANFPVFLSRDPLETAYPGHSSYIISNRNPIAFIDKGGKFGAQIHKEILKAAYTYLKMKVDENVVTGVLRADDMEDGKKGFIQLFATNGHSLDDIHFDGIVGYDNISSYWEIVESRLAKSALTGGVSGKIDFGMVTHTIQDFYSHTNYIELYIDFYRNKNGLPPEVGTIPTFQNASSEFHDFLKSKGNEFRSGDFQLSEVILSILNPWGLGENTHYNMNKDNPESVKGKQIPQGGMQNATYFEYARVTAISATVDVISNGSLSQSTPSSSDPSTAGSNFGNGDTGGESNPGPEER